MESKYCPKCRDTKHIDEFHKSNQTKDGHQGYCKKCRSLRPDNYELFCEKQEKVSDGLKYCGICGEWKPFSEYLCNKKARDGCHSTCKSCRGTRAEGWRAANQDKMKASAYSYYQTPAGIASKARARHKRKNPHVDNTLTYKEWEWVLTAQNNLCIKCGRAFEESFPPTRDHVVPITRDGGLTLENCQAMCRGCNASKGKKSTDYRTAEWWHVVNTLRENFDGESEIMRYDP